MLMLPTIRLRSNGGLLTNHWLPREPLSSAAQAKKSRDRRCCCPASTKARGQVEDTGRARSIVPGAVEDFVVRRSPPRSLPDDHSGPKTQALVPSRPGRSLPALRIHYGSASDESRFLSKRRRGSPCRQAGSPFARPVGNRPSRVVFKPCAIRPEVASSSHPTRSDLVTSVRQVKSEVLFSPRCVELR